MGGLEWVRGWSEASVPKASHTAVSHSRKHLDWPAGLKEFVRDRLGDVDVMFTYVHTYVWKLFFGIPFLKLIIVTVICKDLR